ncbi:MAG: hypothetical protein R3353_01610 [Salegentibacter mishustinae]|nr:hypothetical protein [Salegentibacter mishustinae]
MKLKLIILLIFHSFLTFGKCNCATKIISDVQTKQCTPSLVAYDNTYQVGASINSTYTDISLILTVRFTEKSNTIGSDLLLFVKDEKTLTLKLIDSQKDYIGGSEICHAKFNLTEKDVELLKIRDLSSFRFQFLNEDIYRTFQIKRNNDIIGKQLNCIL